MGFLEVACYKSHRAYRGCEPYKPYVVSAVRGTASAYQGNKNQEKDELNIRRKEFENGMQLYDGNYSEGKRNGKGKEFKDGMLIYEGDYLNGKRSGKGNEFKDGILIYKVYYLNGNRIQLNNYKRFEEFKKKYPNKLYKENNYLNGQLEYEGEYFNKKWNGFKKIL